jgi:superfamily II DNA or RNA helicase
VAHTGRNDPCPCGSGLKFKKCCDAKTVPRQAASDSVDWHLVDQGVGSKMWDFSQRRFAHQISLAMAAFGVDAKSSREWRAFIVAWCLNHLKVSPAGTVRDEFARSEPLSPQERQFVEASGRARLSAWEIVESAPGKWVRARDMVAGVERLIRVPALTTLPRPNVVFLARVVEVGGEVLPLPWHRSLLHIKRARLVIDWLRERAKRRQILVSPGLLQGEEWSRQLVLYWQRVLQTMEPPPMPDEEETNPLAGVMAIVVSASLDPVSRAHLLDIVRGLRTPPSDPALKEAIDYFDARVHGGRPAELYHFGLEEANIHLREEIQRNEADGFQRVYGELLPLLSPVARLRISFATGDVTAFREAIPQCPDWMPQVHKVCAFPFDSAWFAALPPELQAIGAEAILTEAPPRLDDVRPILPSLLQAAPSTALSIHAIFCGDRERARRFLPRDAKDRLIAVGLLRFVEDPASAVRDFNLAARPMLAHPFAVFHVMALHAAGQHDEAQALAERAFEATGREEYQLLSLAPRIVAGEHLALEARHQYTAIPLLVAGLVHCWNGELPPVLVRVLKNGQTKAADAGYLWLASQYAALLRFSGTAFVADPRVPSSPALTSIMNDKRRWERAFLALRGERVAIRGRIAWLLGWDGDTLTSLEAREQFPRADDRGWRSGRAVSLDEVLRGQHAGPQDIEAASALLDEGKEALGRALHGLAGHPAVFWRHARDRAIEVVRRKPTLVVEAEEGGYRMTLRPTCSGSFHVEREGDARVVVYAVPLRHRALAEIVGHGFHVPAAARKAMVDILTQRMDEIDIVSDLLPGERARDTCLYLQLTPQGAAFSASVRARPLGDGGPCLVPGDPATVRTADGLTVERDLDRETALLDSIALGGSDVVLEDVAHVLALLERVRAIGDAIVVEWPQGVPLRLWRTRNEKLRLSAVLAGDWFSISGEVETDEGLVVPLRQILAALDEARGPYLPLKPGQFLALETSLRTQIDTLALCAEKEGPEGLRVHRAAAPFLGDALGAAPEIRRELEKLLAEREFPIPDEFSKVLRDYQAEGFAWLSRLASWGAGACLADDMGLGKTVQTLALVASRGGRTLVVAPTSVCLNWVDEARAFCPSLKVGHYAGVERAAILEGFDVVVCSYRVLTDDIDILADVDWTTVVLDEAHAIKNSSTRRAKAAYRLKAGFRVALSGTPIENHSRELWSLFRFLNPGLLGTERQFHRRFALPVERGNEGVLERLRTMVAPYLLRRTKKQVLTQLPPRIDIVESVEAGPQERSLYEAARLNAIERARQAEDRMTVLAQITRLRRACCHPRLVMPDSHLEGAKHQRLMEILDELREGGHRVLVFSQFTDHLELVRERLEELDHEYLYLDGSTPVEARRKAVEAFQARKAAVFLISLKAGGTGLNLTAADYVIHLDPWWNPAVEDQASDRARRIGQDNPVTVYRLVMRDSIEERILALHARKRELADAILEGTDTVTPLSLEELRGLLEGGMQHQTNGTSAGELSGSGNPVNGNRWYRS